MTDLRPKIRSGLAKLAVRVSDVSGPLDSLTAPVSYTVGRVGNIPQAVMLGTMQGITNTTDPGSIKDLAAVYEDEIEKKRKREEDRRSRARKLWDYIAGTGPGGQGELHVSAGGSEPLTALKRVWTRPGISLPGRLLGTVASPANALLSALTRGDNYDPFAHMVTSYTNDPAIQAHELGHAQNFAEVGMPTLYAAARALPPVMILQEALASRKALPLLREAIMKRDKRLSGKPDGWLARASEERVNRQLTGGMGSYVGSVLGAPAHLSAFAGQLLGYFGKPWGKLTSEQKAVVERAAARLEEAETEEEKKEAIVEFKNEASDLKKAASAPILAHLLYRNGRPI